MVWVWLTQQMKSDLGSPRWSWRGHGKHDWFNGDCQGGNENWMGFSVALEPHHMMLQVFSHVNKLDRAFWQMKGRRGEENGWNRKWKSNQQNLETSVCFAKWKQTYTFSRGINFWTPVFQWLRICSGVFIKCEGLWISLGRPS